MDDRTDGRTRQCPACGAHYDRSEAKCPFCGYIHEEGAEKKFLRGLEEIRDRLDQVDDQARENYRAEVRANSRAIVRRVVIVVVILAAVIGFFALAEYRLFHSKRDVAGEMVWQHEHFGELDRLYEGGDYDELEEKLNEYGAGGHDIWDWEHYDDFMEQQEKSGEQQQ